MGRAASSPSVSMTVGSGSKSARVTCSLMPAYGRYRRSSRPSAASAAHGMTAGTMTLSASRKLILCIVVAPSKSWSTVLCSLEQLRGDRQVVGAVADRLPDAPGGAPEAGQRQRPPGEARDLAAQSRAAVTPDDRVGDAVQLQQPQGLGVVPRGDDAGHARLVQTPQDGSEEQDMGRVGEVDPDLVPAHDAGGSPMSPSPMMPMRVTAGDDSRGAGGSQPATPWVTHAAAGGSTHPSVDVRLPSLIPAGRFWYCRAAPPTRPPAVTHGRAGTR